MAGDERTVERAFLNFLRFFLAASFAFLLASRATWGVHRPGGQIGLGRRTTPCEFGRTLSSASCFLAASSATFFS